MIYYLFACSIHLTKDRIQARLKSLKIFNLMLYREMKQIYFYWIKRIMPIATVDGKHN